MTACVLWEVSMQDLQLIVDSHPHAAEMLVSTPTLLCHALPHALLSPQPPRHACPHPLSKPLNPSYYTLLHVLLKSPQPPCVPKESIPDCNMQHELLAFRSLQNVGAACKQLHRVYGTARTSELIACFLLLLLPLHMQVAR